MITRFGSSIRARLTLWAGVAAAIFCILISLLVMYGALQTADEWRRASAVNAALRTVHHLERGELPTVIIEPDVHAIQVLNARGQVMASTANLAGKPRISELKPVNTASRMLITCDLPEWPGDCQYMAIFRAYQDDGDWLVYSVVEEVPWYVHPALIGSLAGFTVVMVLLTRFGVSRVVAKTLAPVDGIRAELAEITATDPGKRVRIPRNADEIRELARTVNQTLDRLQDAVTQQRRFVSDASHDLRSPITAMRTQIEEALLYPADTDWEETGRALVASLDRLQALVADLLALARLEAGAPTTHQPIDLSELVSAETARPRSKKIITTLHPGVTISGDRLQLTRLLTNLLDNAERHAESTIIVAVRRSRDTAYVEVLDDGAGITPDQRELVFQRFTRLDASRSRDAGGTGLGLPIAREIAAAHHGTLTIEDSDYGARFVLQLPLPEKPPG
ncbi:sensor histidine kinase [Nonomuraea cavernae]|uniref:histidine kinase n=1 Tax=Nonomuraea cavernae TaxID=2045107 RepID=A0A918DLP3_9ACTN|nr:HAMP domain-containing sensor histidine kinase [Nonomuraea cavernae]MCA2187622.1 HAMP domain-containing histidine kinase [Nonomuraea cavernae]GGO71004.1 two-component sensor histidine kinase [Nonomuraea cavernae]